MPVSDEQMNRILTNIAENIPSDCSTGRRINRGSTTIGNNLKSVEFSVSEYEAYRNDIDFMNSFNEQTLADERTYFVNKYGTKVYDFLLAQRTAYIREKNRKDKEEVCKSCTFDASRCNYLYDASKNILLSQQEKKEEENRNLLKFLQSQLPKQDPETTFKKVEYRNEAHEFLSSMNHYITVGYFVILFLMFIILGVTNRLMIKERIVLYLFLIVLPFAFPYFFDILKKIYRYMFPEDSTHGPKNAFLDNRDEMIDSYNV